MARTGPQAERPLGDELPQADADRAPIGPANPSESPKTDAAIAKALAKLKPQSKEKP